MDNDAFLSAIETVRQRRDPSEGIGELREKTVHAVLKQYYMPNRYNREVRVGRYVADIATPDGLIEIQTGNFRGFSKKLSALLEHETVTVVLPLPHTKWISYLDESTGALTERRKSPKTGAFWDCFYELYWIRTMLPDERLTIRLLLLDLEEIRLLNGWSRDRKQGAARYERVPLSLEGELVLHTAEDFLSLLPAGLPFSFTTAELRHLTRLSDTAARRGLALLEQVGVIERRGKRGRSVLYETVK